MEYLLREESNNGRCVEWAMEYMGYCIRDTSDWVSFSLGLVSVLTWTVAEIPQIITNYHQKSTHSLSIAFLATWVIGDIFNVLGCYMEPATLPTQYWTAVLYTMITMVLVMQTVYYDYLYPNMSPVPSQQPVPNANQSEVDDGKTRQIKESVDPKKQEFYADISDKSEPTINEPINVPETRDLYFMSARSLAKSSTPPLGSFLAQRMARQARTALLEPFLAEEEIEAEPEPSPRSKPLLSLVSTLIIVGLVNLYSSSRPSPAGFVIPVGRKLLQVSPGSSEVPKLYSTTASFLGWGMAAIYMGGRIPQIFLNMKKGNVEGLNPLMFLFALIGNATYVASILVNSLEWSDLRPNLPWLVDAGGCVLLDGFILLQFLCLYFRKPKAEEEVGEQEHTYVV